MKKYISPLLFFACSLLFSGCFVETSQIPAYNNDETVFQKADPARLKEIEFSEFDLASSVDPFPVRYRPDDVVRVTVWGHNDLTHDAVVQPDGKIILPLVGEMKADGLTADEIKKNYTEKLVAKIDNRTPARLQYGDALAMTVWLHPDLNSVSVVQQDGSIVFPLAGGIMANGRTINEIQNEIAGRLSKYLKNPVVTIKPEKLQNVTVPSPQVSVLPVRLHKRQVAVLGDVNTPGPQPINGSVRISDALASAGCKESAAMNYIIVIRNPNDKKPQYRMIKMQDFLDGNDATQNIYLKDQDIVLVSKTAINKVGKFVSDVFVGTLPVFQWWIAINQAYDIRRINDHILKSSNPDVNITSP